MENYKNLNEKKTQNYHIMCMYCEVIVEEEARRKYQFFTCNVGD